MGAESIASPPRPAAGYTPPPASGARSEPQASGVGTVTQLVASSWKWRSGESNANPFLAAKFPDQQGKIQGRLPNIGQT